MFITEWLEKIPDPIIKEQALINRRRSSWANQECATLSDAIDWAFSWDGTPEGHMYWSKVKSLYKNFELLNYIEEDGEY